MIHYIQYVYILSPMLVFMKNYAYLVNIITIAGVWHLGHQWISSKSSRTVGTNAQPSHE